MDGKRGPCTFLCGTLFSCRFMILYPASLFRVAIHGPATHQGSGLRWAVNSNYFAIRFKIFFLT